MSDESVPRSPALKVVVEGSIGRIIVNRPTKRNALSTSMWRRIPLALRDVTDRGAAAVVIEGSGGAFSAGADLNEVIRATSSLEDARSYCRSIVTALVAVATCEVPTLAAIDGVAAGGGAELALAADVRLATDRSTFMLPFARLGVVPDDITIRRLERLVGPGASSLAVYGAELLDAGACERLGLFDRVVDTAEFRDETEALARRLAAAAPRVVRAMKRALALGPELCDIGRAAEAMAESFVQPDVAATASNLLSGRTSHA